MPCTTFHATVGGGARAQAVGSTTSSAHANESVNLPDRELRALLYLPQYPPPIARARGLPGPATGGQEHAVEQEHDVHRARRHDTALDQTPPEPHLTPSAVLGGKATGEAAGDGTVAGEDRIERSSSVIFTSESEEEGGEPGPAGVPGCSRWSSKATDDDGDDGASAAEEEGDAGLVDESR